MKARRKQKKRIFQQEPPAGVGPAPAHAMSAEEKRQWKLWHALTDDERARAIDTITGAGWAMADADSAAASALPRAS